MANLFPIPSFIGGISTQPESQRVLGQTSESLNTFLPIQKGLSKRNGTIPIHTSQQYKDVNIVEPTSGEMYFHWIDRDTSRRFLVVISPNATTATDRIQVFDVADGSEKTVTYTSNAYSEDPKAYLANTTGRIKCLTVGDTTFILNTGVTVATAGSSTDYTHTSTHPYVSHDNNNKTLTIRNVDNMYVPSGTDFTINGSGTVYTTTHDAYADTTKDEMVLKINAAINPNPSSTALIHFSNTRIDQPANYHYRPTYLDFPDEPKGNGEYWYAAEDSPGRPAGFYVTQNYNNSGPKYKRVHAREAGWRFKGDTMPIKMFYNGTGFEVTCYDWAERLSGDTATNPAPGFVGNQINSIAFHQDRLWLAWNENVMGSVISDYGNFWLDNWRSVGDTDPVDVATIGTSVTQIRHMMSFNASLVLFCTGDSQFEVRAGGDGAITPTSVNILATTRHSVDTLCTPTHMGGRLFFLSKQDPTKMYEYYYSYVGEANTAVDISLHVQNWLPNSAKELRSSDNNNMVIALFDDTGHRNALYVHYNVLTGNEKVQAAWCKWTFGNDSTENGTDYDVIKSFYIYDSWVYLLSKRGTRYYLDKLFLGDEENDSGLDFSCKLDRRFTATGVYNAGTKQTTWTLPFKDVKIDKVILGGGFGSKAGFERVVTNSTVSNVTVLTCSGNYAGTSFVGRSFNMIVGLTTPYMKDSNNRVMPGVITVLGLRTIHQDTGYYEVQVTPYRRESNTFIFNPVRVGSAIAGEIQIEENGEFYCKPMVSSKNMDISITSDSHLPVRLVSGNMLLRFVPIKRNPAK
jgi:hypothetical protein